MRKKNVKLRLLDGSKWRSTTQTTVNAVLGASGTDYRPVQSLGNQFYNVDNWRARAFGHALCEWTRLNKGAKPTRQDVQAWVDYANNDTVSAREKKIVIASTPDILPMSLAHALVGGGYHEAWHTKYSRRRRLKLSDVEDQVFALWDRVPVDPANDHHGWSFLSHSVLTWSNIVEDIRIERIGCREYPGSPKKMVELQDLILKMEREGEEANEHRKKPEDKALAVVAGAFRDLGLGYESVLQRQTLTKYEEEAPAAWNFVTKGPLTPHLERAINLDSKDDLDSLWLAMEIVSTIYNSQFNNKDDGSDPNAGEGEGEGDDTTDQQAEASGSGGGGKSKRSTSKKPLLYKVGDRAKLKTGQHAGKEVEVVYAGLPDPKTGVQEVRVALVLGGK